MIENIKNDKVEKVEGNNLNKDNFHIDLWERKYQIDNETFAQFVKRISNGNKKIENYFKEKKFTPAGRILAGINTKYNKTLFNCYVLDFSDVPGGRDSRKAINQLEELSDEVSSKGGGIGINWSVIRPKGSYISSNDGRSSGVVSFMDRHAYSQKTITQGGSRRGALLYALNVWHPDIVDFIEAKKNKDKMQNVNISIGISDDFMHAVKNDDMWILEFPEINFDKYDKEWDGDLEKWKNKGYPTKIYDRIRAKKLLRKAAELSHKTGDPGILYLDTINKTSNVNNYKKIRCTNPCGEEALIPFTACCLGSLNFKKFYDMTDEEIEKLVLESIKYLDNIIDKENYFDERIERNQKNFRFIGLGGMGIADLLILEGIRYGSDKARDYIEELMKKILDYAYKSSAKLAKEKGVFPKYDYDRLNKYYLNMCSKETKELVRKHGLRNAWSLSFAPTGSISMFFKVNSGIEPYFRFRYSRNDIMGKREIKAHILNDERVSKDSSVLVSTEDVKSIEHIKMQAAFQRYTDASISKTINLPNDAKVDEIYQTYIDGWEYGLKGITVYRDGSLEGVLTDDNTEKEKENNESREEKNKKPAVIKPREKGMSGKTRSFDTACGKLYITINFDEEGYPFETFLTIGEGGGCISNLNAISRLTSLALRGGVAVEEIADQLESTQVCPAMQYARGKGRKVEGKNCPSNLARFLKEVAPENYKINKIRKIKKENKKIKNDLMKEEKDKRKNGLCPVCNSEIYFSEGCVTCPNCGWTKC